MKHIHQKNSSRMKIITFFYLVLFNFYSFAQDSIVIRGELLNNSRFAKVVVSKFGIGSFPIAAVPIKDNKFLITAPNDLEPGVYRFQYSQSTNEYLDVIINGKEKTIDFNLNILNDVEKRKPFFTQSVENQNWYGYQNQSNLQRQKIEALRQALALYPNSTDKIVAQIQEAIQIEQTNYKKNEYTFIKKNTNTWAARMVQNNPVYFTNPRDDWRLQDFEIRNNFWKGIETNDPKLINTPLYTERILNYLKYYMNPDMHFKEDEMNAGFKKSVDTIMQKFGNNEETKKFALKYLQLGFKELGNEKVLQYIDEKYKELALQCQDEADKEIFEKRLAGYAAMKEGMVAPNITFSNNSTLFNIQSEQILVVFWASWCPHCMEEMPKINAWAEKNTNTKVVAISLDEDKTIYETTIKLFPNVFHDCDLKKWQGKAVNDYYVYGTPTLILLNKEKKIMGKFANFMELENMK